ncbi:MAG: hypothetical protein AVDCRST_MAG91-2871 [uncultured Sphingomonadaceae bacterium]|uniref:Uncharacterized protein n=1 Tax=uncultured Sphingomonadaceae bacterium TaxID=169976 RepID=A0A6J4TQY5_9SPHN|nr:MAG: hypothetical protein AVDCRST_MAG91-2871 [uncultured Sphingomonadaceae bacterium]
MTFRKPFDLDLDLVVCLGCAPRVASPAVSDAVDVGGNEPDARVVQDPAPSSLAA